MVIEKIGVTTIARLQNETLPAFARTFLERDRAFIEFDRVSMRRDGTFLVQKVGCSRATLRAGENSNVFVAFEDLAPLSLEEVFYGSRAISFLTNDYHLHNEPFSKTPVSELESCGHLWCG